MPEYELVIGPFEAENKAKAQEHLWSRLFKLNSPVEVFEIGELKKKG